MGVIIEKIVEGGSASEADVKKGDVILKLTVKRLMLQISCKVMLQEKPQVQRLFLLCGEMENRLNGP